MYLLLQVGNMQKINNAVIAFCLALSTISNAAQTTPNKIQSFAKKHETKIAVIAAAIAGTGLGSYITYYFTARRNKAMKEYYDAVSKKTVNKSTETTTTKTHIADYKERFAALLKAEFEKYIKQSLIVKAIGAWDVLVEIQDEGFRVCLKGEKNIFDDNSPGYHMTIINDWPLWKYQTNKSLKSFVFSTADSVPLTLELYDQKYTCGKNGWGYEPRS